ncbi:MAG: hypothetical protein FJ404_04555 [Verrucomicrobia bacterium]|nr:hypothetical protein [Verrucomicrobiota bacterium]
MLPVMQVRRVRPGAPPEHDVLHRVGGGLGQARPTNNIGIHGYFTTVYPEVFGDHVVMVTQTALSALAQAAQPAGRRREPGAWRTRKGLVLHPPGRRAVGDTAGWQPAPDDRQPLDAPND